MDDSYYQWTRDAGMVMKALLNMYINGNSSMEKALFDYADQSDIIQRVNNPSGGYTTGGLGEPKYNVDNTAFTGAVSISTLEVSSDEY